MKCLGARCQIPNNSNQLNDVINASNMFTMDPMPMTNSQGIGYSSGYQFKENNKLRGSS